MRQRNEDNATLVKHPATDGENCEKVAGFAKTEGNARKHLRF